MAEGAEAIKAPLLSLASPGGGASAVIASAETVCDTGSSGGEGGKREREIPIVVREEKEGRSIITKGCVVVLRRKRAMRGWEVGSG